ncbi:cysteine--tRNA ligase [Bacteriovorax stolpii]|uniref:Cysteine--tRNA ligase n=1 Tax=Bacteriovorax stolpii TaxID=960 RepID=A0A2K9NR86_BACTC|nr:cysteine--tRNA ligase [Bacteriovorax stolpii]AUN98046.1 cysteine--tRNA ligase [Bacteriovorax stolpii]TDP50264.1 cysteinyl-tRNA synthetase [Bacteriovorax stolpii]
MEILVFNNLTRSKEVFKPIDSNQVKFYSCGPTTYNFLHVGNARALVVGDLFHRTMKTLGYNVKFVRNYTDVDDKILEAARQRGIHPKQHADEFIRECNTDMECLGMLPATVTPTVSETMPEIIQMIEDLIKNGYAYTVAKDGGQEVLYNVPKFKDYGKLSKVHLESLQHGIRVETDGHKKHPSDFVLWKPAKPEEGWSWDSPWGKGRPGWHIECSAMAKKHLGKTIDLHHGGVDLLFPHHENEIAQSEAANGCPFCNNWAHNEFLNFGSEKMSKSLGNVVTIRKFTETYSGAILRHILLSVHYRSKLEWTEDSITRAIGEIERIHEFVIHLFGEHKKGTTPASEVEKVKKAHEDIKREMANDFNVPGAMGVFFGLIKDYNRMAKDGYSDDYAFELTEVVNFMKAATGLIHDYPEEILRQLNMARKALSGTTGAGEAEIEELLVQRKEARTAKDWTKSDEIRNRLNELGVVVKDNPDGTYTWSYK